MSNGLRSVGNNGGDGGGGGGGGGFRGTVLLEGLKRILHVQISVGFFSLEAVGRAVKCKENCMAEILP